MVPSKGKILPESELALERIAAAMYVTLQIDDLTGGAGELSAVRAGEVGLIRTVPTSRIAERPHAYTAFSSGMLAYRFGCPESGFGTPTYTNARGHHAGRGHLVGKDVA